MKIAVLIRVYDRIEDLGYNLQIIRDTWKNNEYYIIVVSNGKNKGYTISDDIASKIDKLVILQENAGHKKGNSQLLMEGAKFIPDNCEYTLILEADTWMFGDHIQSNYTNLLSQSSDKVWASADWYDKYYALATDFSIIKTQYIKENPDIFNFELYPECHISNFLRDTGKGYIWITENMPVHVPSYVKKYPYIPNIKECRFYVFPKSKMITHHIEYLKKGMYRKKQYFNIISDTDYFTDVERIQNKSWERFKMKLWISLSKCFIKRSWYSAKTYKQIDE